MKIETGVMILKNGKGWGKTYSDGQCTEYGWMDLESAPIYSPEFCKKTTDVTYRDSPYIDELSSAKLVKAVRKTVVEIVE
jgi:hypothetical protein